MKIRPVNENEMSEKKKVIINLFSIIMVFIFNTGITFFLSPYIIRTVGIEANGFVHLSSNFVSYISLITIALNFMSGRFITIAIVKGDIEKATSYYTSVFWANIILFCFMLVPMSLVIVNLDLLIDIPINLVNDIKLLFGFAFISLIASNILSLWNNIFYVVNRLYLQHIGSLIATFIRVTLLIFLFYLFSPKVWYVTLASMVIVPIVAIWGLWNKNRFLPDLKVNNKYFSFFHLKEIISSGLWRSILITGEMLLSGLDLLICNLFINPTIMGILALSKTIPTLILHLSDVISNSFTPKMLINYAKDEKDVMWADLKRAFKLTAIIGTIPTGGFIIFGFEFYRLWVPSQDTEMLYLLSVVTCIVMVILTGSYPSGQIFTVVNKIKPLALTYVLGGIINILLIFIFIRHTDFGVYAIVGINVLIALMRNICYSIPVSARYLGFKWYKFYIGVLYSITASTIVIIIGLIVKTVHAPKNWLEFFISCFITGILTIITESFIMFNGQERSEIINIIKSKLRRKKKQWKG